MRRTPWHDAWTLHGSISSCLASHPISAALSPSYSSGDFPDCNMLESSYHHLATPRSHHLFWWCSLYTHTDTHKHSSIRMSFKMVKLQCSVLFHCVFRGYKNKNQFHLRYVFSILTITYCFLSITLLSPHLQANTLTQPHLNSDSSNHRPSPLSSCLSLALSPSTHWTLSAMWR